MKYLNNKSILVAVLSVLLSQGCFGEFAHQFLKIYKLHEELVFVNEAKRISFRYYESSADPKKGILLDVVSDPNVIYDENIKEILGDIDKALDVVSKDKTVSFDDAVSMVSSCSTRMMGTLILVVDRSWPKESKKFRLLVEKEISNRGPEADIYSDFKRGYLLVDDSRLIYLKEARLYDILHLDN